MAKKTFTDFQLR